MTMAERLFEVGTMLPQSALAELLDFAEFLKQKNAPTTAGQPKLLADLGGGLEFSTAFSGSPVALQERMRNEWD